MPEGPVINRQFSLEEAAVLIAVWEHDGPAGVKDEQVAVAIAPTPPYAAIDDLAAVGWLTQATDGRNKPRPRRWRLAPGAMELLVATRPVILREAERVLKARQSAGEEAPPAEEVDRQRILIRIVRDTILPGTEGEDAPLAITTSVPPVPREEKKPSTPTRRTEKKPTRPASAHPIREDHESA